VIIGLPLVHSSEETQQLYVNQLIQDEYLKPSLELTDKAEILISNTIGLVTG
jgi:hypothetical protein